MIKHVSSFVGIKWELRDLQYVSEDRGAIIVANHQTIFDVLGTFRGVDVNEPRFTVACSRQRLVFHLLSKVCTITGT